MSRLIIVFISFIVTMVALITAIILPFNDHTIQNIGSRYTILVFPSKYVFLILILIYLSLLYWFYKQWQIVRKKGATFTSSQTLLFVCSSLLQIIWMYYWHQADFITACIALILSVLCLFVFYLQMPEINSWSERLPMTFYFAFLVLLIMINCATILSYHSWNGFGLSQPLWAVIILTAFVAVAIHIRFYHYDPYFPLLFIWFYVGIAIHNNMEELLVTTAALFLSGVLFAGMIFIRKKPRSSSL